MPSNFLLVSDCLWWIEVTKRNIFMSFKNCLHFQAKQFQVRVVLPKRPSLSVFGIGVNEGQAVRMREEIAAAVVFLTRLVKRSDRLSNEKVEEFSSRLSEILAERFRDHWYTNTPSKGQAYRSAPYSQINFFTITELIFEVKRSIHLLVMELH